MVIHGARPLGRILDMYRLSRDDVPSLSRFNHVQKWENKQEKRVKSIEIAWFADDVQETRVFSPKRSWPQHPRHHVLAAGKDFYDMERPGPAWKATDWNPHGSPGGSESFKSSLRPSL